MLGGLVPLQRGQTPPPPPRQCHVSPRQAVQGLGCTTPVGDAKVSWDIQRTRPPGSRDRARFYPPNSVSHEMGGRSIFGVPEAAYDRATPFSAHIIRGDDVGNSISRLTRWKCGTADSSTAIVSLQRTPRCKLEQRLDLIRIESYRIEVFAVNQAPKRGPRQEI